MPLLAIEPRRLYRQIAEQLSGLIAAGEFAIGSRLKRMRAAVRSMERGAWLGR